MPTSLSRRRGMQGVVVAIAVIASLVTPFAINPTPALADTSTQIGSGVECANDEWQSETTADNAGHVYIFYSNYCSNHDFLFYQVSNDGGQTFGAAQSLCAGLGAACTIPQANTHTIGGSGYKTEDDPGLFVDTSVSPPKLYVVWDATPSFSLYSPDVVLGAVSSDYGATFTLLNAGANIAGTLCGAGGNVPDCGFPQITAKGANITVSTGSYSTGANKNNQVKVVAYSSNGGTSFGSRASSGATATNGGYYYALRSVLDTAGNTWTLWFNLDQTTGTGNYVRYELSKTTSGSSTTTWTSAIYGAPDGPTFPGNGMAADPVYPTGWWGGTADLAIDGSNRLYLAYQDGRGHTTDFAPSILRMGTCATASGACTTNGAAAGTWTTQASAPRVDDKDASGCGGTEALSTAKCSVSFPRLTSTSAGVLSLSWVDDRLATVAGCSPNPRFSHTCGLNMWMRQSSTGISGFTSPSVKLSDHTAFSPVWDSDGAGFKFFYGGASGITINPACTNQPFAAWSESVDYYGGATNGGRAYVKNTQSGPASPTSLTAIPNGTQIDLSWPASSGGGVTGYKVYRGSGSTGDNLTLLTTLGNVTSYSNTGLTAGQTFTYAVSAIGGSEGCQSVRASATAGSVVRTLTLATTPGAVGCANITTTPAPTSGNGTCSRTYADGTSVTLSATTPVPIDSSSRYRFNAWSGDATGSGSPSVSMTANRSVTAGYVKQWAVTIQGSGLTCDAPLAFYCDTGADTVVTVQGSPYTGSDVSYAGSGFPTKAYVDDGGTLTYSYSSPVAVPGSTDVPQTLPPDANKQYRLDTVSGPASGSTVTGAVTIDATYVTQRSVTFAQTGIGGDSSGTVVQIDGTGTNPTNASLTAAQLGSAAFYDDGSSWAFQSPVSASSTKRYVVGSTSGTLGQADEGTTKTGAYTAQYLLTLATNPGGVGTGHITPNPTSGDGFYDSGTSVSLTADGSVSVTGTPYTFANWTGDVTAPPDTSNPVNVTMDQARSVTANYSLETFSLDVSKSGTGTGSVSSSPAGITCGATCSANFDPGTVVTLTPVADVGSAFTGWTGGGCSGTGTCVVTMDAAASVTATFDVSGVTRQPDEWIGTRNDPAKMIGDGIYNATGQQQTKSASAKPGSKKTFYVKVQNDGSASDTFLILGSKNSKGFSVRYFAGRKEVTKAVMLGTYQLNPLAPGASKVLKVVVLAKSTATIGAIKKVKVTATANATAIVDAVIAKLKVVR